MKLTKRWLSAAAGLVLTLPLLPGPEAPADEGSWSEDVDVHSANDPGMPRDTRCRGVFSLFDARVRTGMTSAEVCDALLEPVWVAETEVVPIYVLAGLLPVEMTFDGTVFRLSLFDPLGQETVKWYVFLRLDGDSSMDEEDMRRFLAGELDDSRAVLGEYALCFPGPPANRESWIQRYTPEGMELLDWY